MGKVDAALECYLEDPERYADLLNAYWFQGRQIVKPEQVTEKDTRLSGRSRRRRAKKRRKMSQTGAHQKQRDAIRKIVFGAGVTVIALENQTHVHLAMPVRTFVEDALEYDKQLRAIQRGHRKTRDLKEKEEVLSGFSSIDRILPTSTLVLYWGEKKWNGPHDLLDIMDLEGIPEEVQSVINGYPLHVLEVREFKDLDYFQSDLKEVFGIIQHSADADSLLQYTAENQERLENLDEEAYDVIAMVTGNQMLLDRKDEYRKGDDAMNLCKGMVEWAERERQAGLSAGRLEGRTEGREEGRAEGRAEGWVEGQATERQRIAKNAFSMGFDIDKVVVLCGEARELVQTWFYEWNVSVSDSAN